MNKLVQISLVVLLAVAAVAGPVAPTIHKMACFDSGAVSYSLALDSCCIDESEEPQGHTLIALCCDFDELNFSLSDFDFQRASFTSFIPIIAPTSSVVHFEPIQANFISSVAMFRAPPLPTIQRLALLAVFIL